MNRYFTENLKEVTDRVRDGRTVFFKIRFEAEQFARAKGSYHFELYNIERQLIGWGVSK